MAQLDDLPFEILQQIVRYALTEELELKLNEENNVFTSKAPESTLETLNPVLAIMLVNRQFYAAAYGIPASTIILTIGNASEGKYLLWKTDPNIPRLTQTSQSSVSHTRRNFVFY